MTENSSATAEKQVFSADAISREMQAHMRTLAMPCVPGEGVRVAITRAGRRIGVPYGQAKRLWYGEMQTIPAQLADRIRQTAARHQMGPDPEIQSEMAGIRNLLEQILAKLDEEQAAEKPA